MCWVMPPASPATTLASRMASSSEVLPWSTWPMMVTTGARSVRSSALSSDGMSNRPSSTSASETRLTVWPSSVAISSAVSASRMSLILTIWPWAIRILITSTARSAMRLASSCTVMASGMVTSRLSLGACLLVAAHLLVAAAAHGGQRRTAVAIALGAGIGHRQAAAGVRLLAGAAGRPLGRARAGAAAGVLQLGGVDQRPPGRAAGAARVLRPSASDGGAGGNVRDDRHGVGARCHAAGTAGGRGTFAAARRGGGRSCRGGLLAGRRGRGFLGLLARLGAGFFLAGGLLADLAAAGIFLDAAGFLGGEALGVVGLAGRGLAQGALAGVVLGSRSGRSPDGTRAAGCGTAAASAARPAGCVRVRTRRGGRCGALVQAGACPDERRGSASRRPRCAMSATCRGGSPGWERPSGSGSSCRQRSRRRACRRYQPCNSRLFLRKRTVNWRCNGPVFGPVSMPLRLPPLW